MRRRPLTCTGLALVLAMILAACGGGGEPTTAGEGEAAAGADSSADPLTTSGAGADPSGHPEGPDAWPLTGMPVGDIDPDRVAEAATVVKIDNDPSARPQAGLTTADLVYEVKVEGITRFAAVFHSADADPAGPIRSARSTDVDLVANLGRPVFAWSGANPTVHGEVAAAQDRGVLHNLSHDHAPDFYWRDPARTAPHNLYAATGMLRAEAPSESSSPQALFSYRDEGDELVAAAVPSPGVAVDYGGDGRIGAVEFAWDADVGGWARFQTDRRHAGTAAAHRDAQGAQITPENVVVLFVDYTVSAAGGGSPEAISIGEGDALVLTAGHAVRARWARPAPEAPLELATPEGEEVRLTPGRTWLLLPEAGRAAPLTETRARQLLSTP